MRLLLALTGPFVLAACSSGEPAAVPGQPASFPAAAERLLDELPGVTHGGDLELFGGDLSKAGTELPTGWELFTRTDSSGAAVRSLARAVETRGGDLVFRAEVLAGPVGLHVARVPEAAGPIPEEPAALRAWLTQHARSGDLREVVVAAGDAQPPDAILPETNATGSAGSTRVILGIDLLGATAQVGHVSLRRQPAFEVQYKSRVVSAPDFSRGPALGEVNIAGDVRRALVLPLGARRTLELLPESLAGRTRLDFAVAPLLGLTPDAIQTARFLLKLSAQGTPVAQTLLELDPLARPEDRHWQDLSLNLTGLTGLTGGSGLRLELEAEALDGSPHPTLALAIAGLNLVGGESSVRRPNLFLVSLDTVRRDYVGAPGAQGSLTPNLDAFAAEALVFENAESVAPFTLPTHGTVFSGLLPTAHGGLDVSTPMQNATPMLAELLRDAGWSTAAFTGGGYLSPDFGFVRGFERYTVHDPLITAEGLPPLEPKFGPQARALDQTDWDNELRLEAAYGLKLPAVERWIERLRATPVFLFLHTYAAHQYLPPRRIYDEELAGSTSKLTFGPALGELSNERFRREPPSEADIDHLRRLYGASVRHADEGFGAFLTYLKKSGLAETSYVVVFSDHGEELFEHGDFGHSNALFQTLLAVPLMIRGPGIEPTRVPEPVSLLDLAPTLLTLVGQPVEPGFSGRSLVVERDGGFDVASRVATSEVGVFSEVSHHSYFKDSLLLGTHKLVRNYGPDGRGEAFTDRLYDLASDPGERTDLRASEPEVAAHLAQRLTAWRALANAGAATGAANGEVSESTRSQLEDLGYF